MTRYFKTTAKGAGIRYWVVLLALLGACGHPSSERPAPEAEARDWPARFGWGRPAEAKQIAAWDQDVRPDGKGLPPGSGTVPDGRRLYAAKCASCHGATGVEGPYSHLVSSDTSRAKTIGNYWPYATTVFDYIKRAMPFTAPGSLTDEEVYQLTAYLLYANGLIDSGRVIDARTLPAVAMPARKLFVPDDRTGGPEIR
ncbi:MAG TPA: cytochrome c [Chitinophagaceae bacterium]|jgi:cytochrome c|nr:cytochrome c [Chitinophagaceae bacterium]